MIEHRAGISKLGVFAVLLSGFALFILAGPICVSRSREHAYQAQCLHNMVDLAKAHLQFATVNNRFCGYVNSIGSDKKCVSWVPPLFPYIDRQDLANRWTTEAYEWDGLDQTTPSKIKHPPTYIEILVCPTNPPIDEKIGPLGYVVNAGYSADTQPECADADCTTAQPGTGENLANGVFHDQYQRNAPDGFSPQIARSMTMEYLAKHDGAAHTLMLSENAQLVSTWYTTTEDRAPLAFVWYQSASDTPPGKTDMRQINVDKTLPANGRLDFARPSSYHYAGGANMAFCDGHGKFISEDIDYRVYKQLMTAASDLSDDQNPIAQDESMY